MDLNAINELLTILKDAKKAEAVLKSIKDEQQKLIGLIETYSKVNEADMYIAKASKMKAEAELFMSEAKTKSQVLKTEAMDSIVEERHAFQAEVRKVKELENKLQAKEESLVKLEKELTAKEAKLEVSLKELKDLEKTLEVEKKEVAERLAKLKAVMQ